MKRLITMMMLGLCSGAAMGQTKAVLKVPGTNRITEDLKVGTGRTMTFESGATLDVTGATLTGFAGGVTDGDKGDITITSGVWTIDNGVVTAAKLASTLDLSAFTVILPSDVTRLGSTIDLSGGEVTGSLPHTSVSGLGTLATQTATISDYLTLATAASTYVSLSGSYSDPAWITGLAWTKVTGEPTTVAGYGITDAIAGAVGTTDNTVPRANGTGGLTLQGSLVTIDDVGNITAPGLFSPSGNGFEQTTIYPAQLTFDFTDGDTITNSVTFRPRYDVSGVTTYLFPPALGTDVDKVLVISGYDAGEVTLDWIEVEGSSGGTVTSVTGTGTVSGLSLSGTVTTSGSLTLSGAITGFQVSDAALTALSGGSDFVQFSGPTTSTKTFTLPNASSTILTSNAAVTVGQGGTGRATSTTAYGLIAAGTTATGAHQTVAAGLTTQLLVGGGTSALPIWTTATGTGAPVRAGSPAFTGDPTAPTPGNTDDDTSIATTEWVNDSRVALIQRVTVTDTDLTRNTTSGSYVTTGVSVTSAALRSTSSKILIRVYGVVGGSVSNAALFTLYRTIGAGSPTDITPGGLNSWYATRQGTSSGADFASLSFEAPDSPATTDTVTYTLYWQTTTGTIRLGRRGSDATVQSPTVMVLEEYR